MFVSLNIRLILSGVVAMLSLSACNGLFEGIYDEPFAEDKRAFGFISVDDQHHTGRIYLDATDYTEWHYIDLLNKTVTTQKTDEKAPASWDFAVHRYDAKTNGGAALESTAADFSSLPPLSAFPEADFTADEWTTDRIAIDMSQMMDSIILYTEDYYNPCLSKWFKVDKSTMPPIYTLSGKVYLLRLADGSHAALRLSNYMNSAGVKGFMTIDYLYPVQP